MMHALASIIILNLLHCTNHCVFVTCSWLIWKRGEITVMCYCTKRDRQCRETAVQVVA